MPRSRPDQSLRGPRRGARRVMLIVTALLLVGAWPAAPGRAAQNVAAPGTCQELIVNGGFETPHEAWTEYSSQAYDLMDQFYPHTGSYSAWLVADNGEEGWISQTVMLPANTSSLQLSYWWSVFTQENPGGAFDFLKVQLLRVDGVLLSTIATYSNDSAEAWVWNQATTDLSSYAGQTLQLRYQAKNDANNASSFFVDDVSIQACTEGGTATLTPAATATATVTPGPSPTFSSTPRFRLFLPLILRQG